jgi:hypothetical protein
MKATSAHRRVNLGAWILVSLAGLAGCGGANSALIVPNPASPVGLPAPPTPAGANTYSGVQSPGQWTFTLDNSQNTFSYLSVTYPVSPNNAVTGAIQSSNGFTRLLVNGASAGYALEVRGRFAILRPGDSGVAPVLAVPQTTCYALGGRSRLQYVALPAAEIGALTAAPVFGYGSIVASTDSSGKNWQFIDLQGNVVSGPASFAGTCASAAQQSDIGFTGLQTAFNDSWAGVAQVIPTPGTESSISVGPSGFFVGDQSDPTTAQPTGASVAGVLEPASPLNSTDITAQQYNGFLYQAATTIGLNGVPGTLAYTAPVAFGQPAIAAKQLVGGAFPGDDPAQSPQTNITLTLGAQDATYNGFYAAASITLPDPAQNCANYTGPGNNSTAGLDAQGYPTCTFPALAIAGNPEGKYAIFLSSYNWAARLGGAPMQIYLVQK